MTNTIIYWIAFILITVIYFLSYWRLHKNRDLMLDEWIEKTKNAVDFWRGICHDAEKERDELTVKLCEATMWCEVGYPEDNSRVLVCSVTTKGEKRINIAYYEDGSWHGNGNLDNVIAWKSLPEMPEGGEE